MRRMNGWISSGWCESAVWRARPLQQHALSVHPLRDGDVLTHTHRINMKLVRRKRCNTEIQMPFTVSMLIDGLLVG
uniref:Uncharacterized protein n=1 Tax=Setaria digitata TaxID=48799 RepID=A0A915Q3U6_9BILA